MWNEYCIKDLDLPLHYDDTLRDSQLEQVRHSEEVPQLDIAPLEQPSLRISIVDRVKRCAPLFSPLLNDLQIALMAPRTSDLVKTYMCVLYNIAVRGGGDATLKNQILYFFMHPTTTPEWNVYLLLRVWWRRFTKFIMDLYIRYIYERPYPLYRWYLSLTRSTEAILSGEQLVRDGIVILPEFVRGSLLEAARRDFSAWCLTKQPDCKLTTKFDGGQNESYLSTSLALSMIAVDPFLRTIVDYYLGKPGYLAYTRGYRTEPIAPERYRAFQWHHDLKRKMVKVMVLLTDVAKDGQRMDYCVGSHKVWQKFETQWDTKFEDKFVEGLGYKIEAAAGRAGTVIVFDPNGYHSGNRNLTKRRDQYTFNYTGGWGLFPVKLHPDAC